MEFTHHEIDLGPARHLTVLTGAFLAESALEIATVSLAEDGTRPLQIFTFDGESWKMVMTKELPHGVQFVDVLEGSGCDRLITVRNGTIHWLDLETASLNLLTEMDVELVSGDKTIPQVDITRDVNGDDLDDLVIPDVNGFWISIQTGDGLFSEPVKLGPPEPFLDEKGLEDDRMYREVGLTARTIPQYLSRVHSLDFNGDGRVDLAFWNKDHFDVYLQLPNGVFASETTTFVPDVAFEADGVYTHMFGYDEENGFGLLMGTRAKTRHTALHSFVDVNGDAVADLVTHTLEGRSLIKMKSSMAVHFGSYSDGELGFHRAPSATFGPIGSQPMGYAGQRFQDLNDDGELELALVNVDAGIADMFQVMLANSIDVDVHVYRPLNGVYPGQPTYSRRIKPVDKILGRRDPFFPPVLGGDVNGDGLSELIVGHSRNELRVYAGVPGDQLFSREPTCVEVRLPGDERNVWLKDLNVDGKQDLLIKLPSDDGAHRITILISR